jgi:glucose/arabinose dehydrogenase
MARFVGAVLACSLGFAVSAHAQLITTRVASGLAYPIYATAPVGDAERLFIVQQRGQIRILDSGTLLTRPFLDIDPLVPNITGNDERGLLGLAFPPDYATSGYFYVYYTDLLGDSRVRRFTVSADPDSADASSAFDILWADQPDVNHNGGTIHFGPDGYLWIGFGDGGGSYDTYGNGQNPATLLGKMLRIDPTSDAFPGDPLQNYSIPPDNPFVGEPTFRDEIWAYGLRNPYRWSFDRLTGDMYIADVGQACWEEIDFEAASAPGGRNYGWPELEGNHCLAMFNCFSTGCDSTGMTLPIHEFSHAQDGFSCSVTGGYVYRGTAIPNLAGTYFYADFCSQQIYSFRYDGVNVTQLTKRTSELAPGGGLFIEAVAGFAEDGLGEMYIIDRAATSGEVYKILKHPASDVGPIPPGRAALQLGRAVPNPFDVETNFDLQMTAGAPLRVSIHDAAGRLIRNLWNGPSASTVQTLSWDGRDARSQPVPSGVYFLRAESGEEQATQRVTRLR